jgi:hypothetical protein
MSFDCRQSDRIFLCDNCGPATVRRCNSEKEKKKDDEQTQPLRSTHFPSPYGHDFEAILKAVGLNCYGHSILRRLELEQEALVMRREK